MNRPRPRFAAHFVAFPAFAGLMLCGLFSCEQTPGEHAPEPSVVVYASADEFLARDIASMFSVETGIRVDLVGDTEASKTTGLVQRLRAEQDRPRADVFWSSEIFQTIDLATAGVLEAPSATVGTHWPEQYRDAQRRWFALGARPRVFVVNTNRLPNEQRPKSWNDLASPIWDGRVVMADPRFGTTGGHLAAIRTVWGAARYRAWLDALAMNDIRLLPSGNAGVVEAVASGEADIGLTDADDVYAAQERGLPVAMILPRHAALSIPAGGTLLIPNTVARVAGGPHPENADRFIEFMLSEAAERRLAESTSHNVPLGPGRAEQFPQYQVQDAMIVDFAGAAAQRLTAIDEAMQRLRPGS